jgi:ABC-type transport system involved in multi-copper enzyme maturation permease subunit
MDGQKQRIGMRDRLGPFLAIVGDTWRQSKHQWVLLVLIGLIAVFALFAAGCPSVREAPDGTPFLTTWNARATDQSGFEAEWERLYATSLRRELGYDDRLAAQRRDINKVIDRFQEVDFEIKRLESRAPDAPELPQLRDQRRALEREIDLRNDETRGIEAFVRQEVNRRTAEQTAALSPLQKGVECWLSSTAVLLFMVSMIGFIAACAGYIPNMIESGGVDLVLSKPIRRWHLFFGKYVGGLLLYAGVLLAVYVFLFVAMGVRTGVWHWPFFLALPVTVFSLALLYAIVGWVGLWTRGTAMAMVIGYVYYLAVDTAIGYLGDRSAMPFLGDSEFFEKLGDITRMTFPSFVWLRRSAEAAVYSLEVLPWQHIGVGAAWLVICLATAYNRFRINDY